MQTVASQEDKPDPAPKPLTREQRIWAWSYFVPVALIRGAVVAIVVYWVSYIVTHLFLPAGFAFVLGFAAFPVSFTHQTSEHAPLYKQRVALIAALSVAVLYTAFYAWYWAKSKGAPAELAALTIPLLGCFIGYKRAIKKLNWSDSAATREAVANVHKKHWYDQPGK